MEKVDFTAGQLDILSAHSPHLFTSVFPDMLRISIVPL